MKRFGVMILVFIILTPVSIWGQKETDTFRGIKWGTDINELPDLAVVAESGNVKTCSRKGEQNKIGDAEIDGIRYQFYKERFCGVSIGFNENRNFRLLKEGLLEKYGPGSKPNRYLEKYNWILGDLWIILNFSEIQKKGTIYYYYNPISKEMIRDEKEAGRKAKDGL